MSFQTARQLAVYPEMEKVQSSWPVNASKQYNQELSLTKYGFRPEDRLSTTDTLKGIRHCRQLINITRGLVSRGYSDTEIKGMLGGNWLRVLEAVWK